MFDIKCSGVHNAGLRRARWLSVGIISFILVRYAGLKASEAKCSEETNDFEGSKGSVLFHFDIQGVLSVLSFGNLSVTEYVQLTTALCSSFVSILLVTSRNLDQLQRRQVRQPHVPLRHCIIITSSKKKLPPPRICRKLR